jgi:hypothetical protein
MMILAVTRAKIYQLWQEIYNLVSKLPGHYSVIMAARVGLLLP